MKHRKTVAYTCTFQWKTLVTWPKNWHWFCLFLGVLCHFSINIRIEVHFFLFALGNKRTLVACQSLRSASNENKKKCSSILKYSFCKRLRYKRWRKFHWPFTKGRPSKILTDFSLWRHNQMTNLTNSCDVTIEYLHFQWSLLLWILGHFWHSFFHETIPVLYEPVDVLNTALLFITDISWPKKDNFDEV